MRSRFLTLLWALVALPVLAQVTTEVIQLRYRNAEDVIPVLRPLLVPGATITGIQNKLIVKTTPANLAELRKVLDVIDDAPKRLLISVKQVQAGSASSRDLEVSGRVGTGPDSVSAQIEQSDSVRSTGTTQSVQVIEGNAAFIRTGTSIPVRSRQRTIEPSGAVRQSDTIEYKDADTGFYAQPRVNGDQVTIQIAARRDSVSDDRRGAINIQRVESVVSGRLGEWLEVGAIQQEEFRDERGIIYKRSTSGEDARRTYLKVEKVK